MNATARECHAQSLERKTATTTEAVRPHLSTISTPTHEECLEFIGAGIPELEHDPNPGRPLRGAESHESGLAICKFGVPGRSRERTSRHVTQIYQGSIRPATENRLKSLRFPSLAGRILHAHYPSMLLSRLRSGDEQGDGTEAVEEGVQGDRGDEAPGSLIENTEGHREEEQSDRRGHLRSVNGGEE